MFIGRDYEFISKRFDIPYISFIISTKTATTIPQQVLANGLGYFLRVTISGSARPRPLGG